MNAYKKAPLSYCQTLFNRSNNMHNISMLLLPVLCLLSGVICGVSAEESVPTYKRRDPITGETLICEMCPPGKHMVVHCTATSRTVCAPCSADHFTALPNYLPRCLYCNNFCYDNLEVETECSAVNNRVCRCKKGFYLADDFCMRHSECGPGHGVVNKGTPQMNTVCEKCSDGQFSSSSSALDSCVNHQKCAAGKAVLLPGSIYHDAVCGTCEDLANGGETKRAFLSGFFSMHRMRLAKMKKFVARHIYKSGEERCTSGTAVPRQRGLLLDEIKAWLAHAPQEELDKLPQLLRATQLSSMADKLDKILYDIKQQTPNCSLQVDVL